MRKLRKRCRGMRKAARLLAGLLCIFCGALPAFAQLNSPGVYDLGNAGPYKLFVTVRPPAVIPGVALVRVRTSAGDIRQIRMAPEPPAQENSHLPAPLTLRRSKQDSHLYTGNLRIMAPGSWQIRFLVDGVQGKGELMIPLAAAPTAVVKTRPWLRTLLALFGALLVLGMVGLVAVFLRNARRPPGVPASSARRCTRRVMVAVLAVLLAVWLVGWRWSEDAAGYARNVYKPLNMQAVLLPHNILELTLSQPAGIGRGWMRHRKTDDFVLDHSHPMHLYMIREPEMDVAFHLHPKLSAPGRFQMELPSMPAGSYYLYADVMHADGFPETLVTTIKLPSIAGRAPSGDDAEGHAPPLTEANDRQTIFRLPDGYVMVWARPPVLKALQPYVFEFYLLDPQGRPPADMALYMGMLGHAAFVRSDGKVFAHIHPGGSGAMAAMMLAHRTAPDAQKAAPVSMPMQMPAEGAPAALPNRVQFPYGFPTPGKYRIFVQMKHGDTIETAAFDANVAK